MKDPNWIKCLINDDSRNVIKHIPDNSIDFIFTDPPYNIGQHSTGNINLPGRAPINNNVAQWDWVDFNPEEWADEFIRILKPNGNLFIFTSYNQIGRWYKCLDQKFDTSNFMIWHKTNPAPKIFKAGFLNSCEMIFTCWNKGHTWNFISQKDMHNFIESPICMKPERLDNPKHPAQKPLSILKKIINIASNKNDIIFDPFMGVGSIGVAALELERKYIGIEIEKNYFMAAKKRIEKSISYNHKTYKIDIESNHCQVSESGLNYNIQQPTNLLNSYYRSSRCNIKTHIENEFTTLQPIIKWAGGKEKELKYILPNLPQFKRYIEPFVGGGSVFTAINAEEHYINDLSSELISLYKYIATSDTTFFNYANAINNTWHNTNTFFINNQQIVDIYIDYRKEIISKSELKTIISDFCHKNRDKIDAIIDLSINHLPSILCKEIETNLFRKMCRMKELELKKNPLPDNDILDNIETAFKSAVYMYFRSLYNNTDIIHNNPLLHCALFLFIRNYSYSGMFRYNANGQFNVPYGGIAYNSKTLDKKLVYYSSTELLNHFKSTHIYNYDFEMFLEQVAPTENDFIFLDPPYDSEFSTYSQNEFNHNDHCRLADYLINKCKAKWMLIIKHTDFIYNLYNKENINIKTFDKEYLVSFMNRNNRNATHLLITNYFL